MRRVVAGLTSAVFLLSCPVEPSADGGVDPTPVCGPDLGLPSQCRVEVEGEHTLGLSLTAGAYVAVSASSSALFTLGASYENEVLETRTDAQPARLALLNPTTGALRARLVLRAGRARVTVQLTPMAFQPGIRCNSDCGTLLQVPAPRESSPYRLVSPLKYQFGRRELVQTLLVAVAAQPGLSPVGVMDLSQEDGQVPGSDVGVPRHPYPAHSGGYAADVAYYREGADHSGQPTCPSSTSGRFCSGPSDMSPARNVTFFLSLAQAQRLVQVVVDPVMDAAVRTEVQRRAVSEPINANRLSRMLSSGPIFPYHTDHSHFAFAREPKDVTNINADHTGAESAIAVGPRGDVMVAFMVLDDQNAIGYAYSPNYGNDWSDTRLIRAPEARFRSNDPSLIVTPDGTFYLTWLAQTLPVTAGHVYVAKAAPSTGLFGAPAEATDPAEPFNYDRPNLALAPGGSLLVTYGRGPSNGRTLDTIMVASSTNGLSWTRSVVAGGAGVVGFRNFPSLCVAQGVGVYLVYGEQGVLHLRRGLNGSAWETFDQTAIFGFPTTADARCVADGSDVWVVDAQAHSFPPAGAPTLDHIFLAHSSDRGTSFGVPVAAEDPAAGSLFMLYGVALSADGLASVVYYAGRNDGDTAASLRVSRARDRAATGFWPSFTLGGAVTMRTGHGPTWLGDYLGTVDTQGSVFVSFTDNGNAKSRVVVTRIVLP